MVRCGRGGEGTAMFESWIKLLGLELFMMFVVYIYINQESFKGSSQWTS